jgi:hypothetical protein
MKIHPEPQNSLEWLLARSGIPTASEFDAIISPKWEIRSGEMPRTYLAKKVAEKWSGTPAAGFNTLDMDFGKILEEEALPFFELETGKAVQRLGLITTDDGTVGCSPDGWLYDSTGLEVKCLERHNHVRHLLAGELPKDYAAQVHGGMWVTGATSWTFLSYCRGFPPLIVTVKRDEEIMEAISGALALFLAQMQVALAKLEQLNGGPPKPWRHQLNNTFI